MGGRLSGVVTSAGRSPCARPLGGLPRDQLPAADPGPSSPDRRRFIRACPDCRRPGTGNDPRPRVRHPRRPEPTRRAGLGLRRRGHPVPMIGRRRADPRLPSTPINRSIPGSRAHVATCARLQDYHNGSWETSSRSGATARLAASQRQRVARLRAPGNRESPSACRGAGETQNRRTVAPFANRPRT